MHPSSLLILVTSAATLTSAINLDQRTNTTSFDCLPGQSCWPTRAEWMAFNESVSGNLFETVMLGSSCFPNESDYDEIVCADVRANYGNGDFREVMGAMQYTNWETCGAANCLPSVLAPQSATCSLGRISAYYVEAQCAEHVAATLQFVTSHGIRLIVKNTGHDYLGRSSAANTLALRTFGMKNMSYDAQFEAYNCPASDAENVGVIGAGIVGHEAIDFFLQSGMDVTVGACPSVGTAGGYGQGGGHGLFGPSYGLMVDQAVEFDVVLTNGEMRTINQCNDPDLFWAMRGGGGGTYAILVNYKFKVYPKKTIAMYSFRANISESAIVSNITQSVILRDTLAALASNQSNWSNNGIAGYDFLFPDSFETHQILPSSGDAVAELQNLTAQWASFLTNHPGFNIIENDYVLFENQSAFEIGTASITARNGAVGLGVITPSRLIPRTSFSTPNNIDALMTAILQGMENAVSLSIPPNSVALGIYKTTPANTPDVELTTSVNPSWRSALWHVIFAGGWVQGTPDEDIDTIQAGARSGIEALDEVLDVKASYTNEADFGEVEWRDVFFGDNYERLLGVKKTYDPVGLLDCWKCVGWLGAEEQMYSCYGNNPQPSTPA